VSELHQKYGHIVRVAPDELSYDIPDAWEEIYSRGSTKLENRRPEWFVSSKLNNIIGANESDHKRMKAILAPGFSKSALMEQEPVIKRHLDLFICQLREVTRDGTTPINFIKWVNYLTFDIIGDLLFGEDFGCVAGDEVMRQWQNTLIRNLRLLHTLTLCNRIWLFYLALPLRDMWTFVTAYTLFDDVVDSRVKNRGTKGVPDKIDFLELMRTGRNGAVSSRDPAQYFTRLTLFSQ
jgi:cytochrome P450